jgi:hypothetical protein
VDVRIEMGAVGAGVTRGGRRASLGMPSKRVASVAGSGALRITGRRVGDVRFLKTSSTLLLPGWARWTVYASN